MIDAIMNGKLKLIGRLLSYNKLLTVIMEGKINIKRTRGRRHKFFFEEIFQLMKFASY